MQLVDFSAGRAEPVTRFSSNGVRAVAVGHGRGEAHIYSLHLEPGGVIGPHLTGFAQLLLVVAGSGWVASADGVRHGVSEGRGAYFDRGEQHSKGSDTGMTAIMIQVDAINLP